MKKSISVIIYTHNEKSNILDCIKSAELLTDEIIVIDSQSIDKTVEIAQENKTKVYSFPKSSYVEPAREFGINKAQTDWVFILDADERITKELAEEILKPDFAKALSGEQVQDDKNSIFTHYRVLRKNIFCQKWLKYGGWWPDSQTRLINKKYFKTWPKEIHSTPKIEGNRGMLKNPLVHYFHGDIEQMVNKTIVFEEIESNLLLKANKSVSVLTFFRKFLGELFRRLIKKMGFIDGQIGIIESIYQAFSKTITYLFLYEKKNSRSL